MDTFGPEPIKPRRVRPLLRIGCWRRSFRSPLFSVARSCSAGALRQAGSGVETRETSEVIPPVVAGRLCAPCFAGPGGRRTLRADQSRCPGLSDTARVAVAGKRALVLDPYTQLQVE